MANMCFGGIHGNIFFLEVSDSKLATQILFNSRNELIFVHTLVMKTQ
jgi:hypothetical protein